MNDFQTFREPPVNHTHSSAKKKKSKPFVLGWNLKVHFDKLSHTGRKSIPFTLLNWLLQHRAWPRGPVSMSDTIMSIPPMFIPQRFTGQALLSTMGQKDLQDLAFMDPVV